MNGDIFVWVGAICGVLAAASFLSLSVFMIWTLRRREKFNKTKHQNEDHNS